MNTRRPRLPAPPVPSKAFFCRSAFFVLLCLGTLSRAEPSEIFDAIRSNDVLRVNAILKHSGTNVVHEVLPEDITPLHLAAALNCKDIATLLIFAGADLNARNSRGFTPLHWAAGRNAVDAVRLLIIAGANVNAKADQDITPLHWAANKNAAKAIALLSAAGADPQAKTVSGFTPLHWATMKKASDAATWLAFTIVSDQMDKEQPEASSADAQRILPAKPPAPASPPALAPPPDASLPPLPPPPVSPDVPDPGRNTQTLLVQIGMDEHLVFVWVESLQLWFGRFEVTNSQFKKFRPKHQSLFRESFSLDGPDQPVVYVSYNDARDFCEWLNSTFSVSIPLGTLFRLPTEAEWIACARCGDNRKYPWGDELPPRYGNFSDLSARREWSDWTGVRRYEDGFPVSCPVAESGRNDWDIYGMAGNVWEWCDGWYDSAKKYRIRKGGSWDFGGPQTLSIDYRGFDKPETKDDVIGFRLVVSPKTKPAVPKKK